MRALVVLVCIAVFTCHSAGAFLQNDGDTVSGKLQKSVDENRKLIQLLVRSVQAMEKDVFVLNVDQRVRYDELKKYQMSDVDNVKLSEFCYNTSPTTLSCPLEQCLHIKRAEYGRRSTRSICPAPNYDDNNPVCLGDYIRPTQYMRSVCEARNSCSFKVESKFLGDPCRRINKILYVQYLCGAC